MENLFKNTFLLDEKNCLHWKLLLVAVIRILYRLLYNLNNGLHQQQIKFEVKTNTFFSGLKNVFPLAGMKNSLKNI